MMMTMYKNLPSGDNFKYLKVNLFIQMDSVKEYITLWRLTSHVKGFIKDNNIKNNEMGFVDKDNPNTHKNNKRTGYDSKGDK